MKIGNLTDSQVTMVAIALIVVIAIGILTMSYFELKKIGPYKELPGILQKFAKTKKKTVAKQIKDKEDLIKKHEADIAEKEVLEEKIKDLEADWKKLHDILPKGLEFARLMVSIAKEAEKSGIKIDSIERKDPVPYDGNVDKITFDLRNMEGAFHDYGNFLYVLFASLKRFMVC
jgi:Tfp pilus assembly protein PilO